MGVTWNGIDLSNEMDSCNFESIATTQGEEIVLTNIPVRGFPMMDIFAEDNPSFNSSNKVFDNGGSTAQQKWEALNALRGTVGILNYEGIPLANVMLVKPSQIKYAFGSKGLFGIFTISWALVGPPS